MSDSDDTIPYNIEELGEPSKREQSPSPIPPPWPTPPRGWQNGRRRHRETKGATKRGGSPRRGGGPPRHGGRGHQMT